MRNDGTCGGVYLREYEREKTVRLERMARHCPVRTESITVTQELEWSVSGARFHSPEPLRPPRSPHSETQTHRSDSTVEENRHCPSKPRWRSRTPTQRAAQVKGFSIWEHLGQRMFSRKCKKLQVYINALALIRSFFFSHRNLPKLVTSPSQDSSYKLLCNVLLYEMFSGSTHVNREDFI